MHESLSKDALRVPGFARIDVVERSRSTNAELAAAVRSDPAAWPALSALVAEHQTAGKGRAGRSWQTPPRAGLTVSVLLQPQVPTASLGWLPLLAGLAVVRAVSGPVADGGTLSPALKWPNDVLLPFAEPVDGFGVYRKVAGILAEVVPQATGPGPVRPAVVLGIGLNVRQAADELPVPTATSLALAGQPEADRTEVLVRLLTEVGVVVERWERAGGDAVVAGLRDEYTAASATLGTRVRAELAGGTDLVRGEAVGLDDAGALIIRTDSGVERAVTAGDVWHLR